MSIGEIIYKNRKKAGLSQEELADMLNVTRQSISLWETDQTVPSTANLVRLTEIFHISMDELCGKEASAPDGANEEQTNTQTEPAKENIIAETSAEYSKPLLKSMYKSQFGGSLTFRILISAILVLIIMILPFTAAKTEQVIMCSISLAVAAAIIIAVPIISINIYVNKAFKSQPNHKNTVKFYFDHFEVDSVSDSSSVKYTKSYSEIKKVKYTKDYIFIFYDNAITPIIKANLGENADVICRLLKIDFKEITDKKRIAVRITLLVMFILSIASIFIAFVITITAFESSPMPEYASNLSEYLWIFYTIIPIPLASAILGIVFLTKHYKCKKNVIAGFIMTLILAIYGSFTPLMAKDIKHDFGFADGIENALAIDLPNSGYISYQLDINEQIKADAMIKPDSGEQVKAMLDSCDWLKKSELPLSNIIPYSPMLMTSECDYFYLYDYDCRESNNFTAIEHSGHNFIYLAYSEQTNIIRIYCFQLG